MSQRQKYTIAGLLSLLLASLCMFFIKVQHVTGAMMLALLAMMLALLNCRLDRGVYSNRVHSFVIHEASSENPAPVF